MQLGMKKLLMILFVSCTFAAYSQTDSISVIDKITATDASKSELISKGRRLILKDLEAGNIEEALETFKYLSSEIEDSDHLAFWPRERLLLYFWTGDYVELLNLGLYANLDSKDNSFQPSFMPSDDLIARKLDIRVREEYEEIVDDFESMSFSPDSNEFLLLLLNRLLLKDKDNYMSLDEINKRSDQFLRKYPESPLSKIIKENVAYKLQIGDWGIGLTLGGGFNFVSGNITDLVDFNAGGVNIALDAYYKKLYFGFDITAAFGDLKNDLPIKNKDKIWPQDIQLPITLAVPRIGYKIIDYQRFWLTPFAGVSFNSASPNQDDLDDYPELKKINLGISVSPMVGLNADIALNNPKKISPYSAFPGSIYSLGLKMMYTPSVITNQGAKMKGQIFFIGLTFKMYIFQVKQGY